MNNSHTPGPWIFSHSPAQNRINVTGNERDDGPQLFRDFVCSVGKVNGGVGEIEEANARLIAAAPDLLAALVETAKQLNEAIEVLDASRMKHRAMPFIPALTQAYAAIDKATGGAS